MTCTGHHWYGAVPDSEKNSCKPWELYGIVIFMHSGATKLQEQVQSLIPKSASCRSELREAAPMLLRSYCGSISDHRFFTQGSACGFTARWRSYGSEAETKAQWIGLRENLQKKHMSWENLWFPNQSIEKQCHSHFTT